MNKQLIFILSVIVLSVLFQGNLFAQTLELNTKQSLTVSNPGFFPLSNISNEQFKMSFQTINMIEVEFSNFLGSPCNIAPAADFSGISSPIRVSGNGTITIDFSSKPTGGTYGLSIVPQGGVCLFDILAKLPNIPIISLSSSSSGAISTTGGEDTTDIFNPNSFSILEGPLPQELVDTLSNEGNNPNCQNSPSGIDSNTLGQQGFYDRVFDSLTDEFNSSNMTRENTRYLTSKANTNAFTLTIPTNKKSAKGTFNLQLTNTSDKTKIFVTGIFPSQVETTTTPIKSMGSKQITLDEIEVTTRFQDIAALAAVQHAIVSATMPWQLSKGNGFFIVQGGGCVGPFCTIVESGMVVIVPGGACTPEKLTKRKAGYSTVNPSKFFDPFPFASMVIQIPTKDIVNPSHPLVAKAVREKAYLIFQPVPPKTMLIQQLMLGITNP